jgi:hypothetical protein
MGSTDNHGNSSKYVSSSQKASSATKRAGRRRARSKRKDTSLWFKEVFPVKRDRFVGFVEYLRYRKGLGEKTAYSLYHWYNDGMPKVVRPLGIDGYNAYLDWLKSRQPKKGGDGRNQTIVAKANAKFDWAGLPHPKSEAHVGVSNRQHKRARYKKGTGRGKR